ncbi:hypothetical protein ECC02_011717 [Trypanosoma cruzi]|uniref:Uncharacterized protein n=1 Tax=Trypanosoma cruzi TaxID=5693 RepID=A0A7J6XME5_TRYCR|nr:hypothetical protein ECC02_011717 [Trypanosoma cruzi]
MPLYLLECTRHIAFPSRRRQNPLRPLGCAARPPCESCLLAAHRMPHRSRTSQKSTKLGYLVSFPRCCDAPVRQLPLLGQPKQQRRHSVIRVPQGQLHKGVDSARWPRCVQRRRRKKEDLLPSLLRWRVLQKNIVGRRRTGITVGVPQNTLDGTTTRWRRKMGKKTVRATSVRRPRNMPKRMHSVYLSACQAMICNDQKKKQQKTSKKKRSDEWMKVGQYTPLEVVDWGGGGTRQTREKRTTHNSATTMQTRNCIKYTQEK